MAESLILNNIGVGGGVEGGVEGCVFTLYDKGVLGMNE